MSLFSAATLLFLVMDPVGNIPFFIAALRDVEPERHNKVILRELLIALGVMVVFLFVGRYALNLLHLSEPALTLAGGVILFLIALRMVFPSTEKSMQEELRGEPFIVPLAIPYVAGPSLLATELLMMSKEPERWPEWLAAVVLAWLACAIVVMFGSRLKRFVGPKALTATERLMGMILVAVAMQMFLTGVESFLKQAR